jgi:hypothetical protein
MFELLSPIAPSTDKATKHPRGICPEVLEELSMLHAMLQGTGNEQEPVRYKKTSRPMKPGGD